MARPSKQLLFTALVVCLCLVHLIAAFTLSLEDSEIWGITSSRRIFQLDKLWNSAWFKPAFSILLGGIVKFAPDNWSALTMSRALSWLFSISIIISMGQLLCERYRSSLLTIAVLSPVVVLNLTKVRSDLFAVAVALLTLQKLLNTEFSKQDKRALIFFVGGTSALLLTPKSIDLYLILLVALFQPWPADRRQLVRTVVVGLFPIAGALLLLRLFSRETLYQLVRYLFDSYKNLDRSWVYLYDLIKTSPITAGAVGIGLALALWNYSRLKSQQRALVWMAIISLVFVFIAPQKLPFLLVSRLPLWLLGASVGLQFLCSKSLLLQRSIAALSVISAMGISSINWARSPRPHFAMSTQRDAYLTLDHFLEGMGPVRYWDAIGLFPKRNMLFHYPSPGDSSNDDILDFLVESKPAVILKTSKARLLGPAFENWLRQEYVESSVNIWTRRISIATSETCSWPSELLLKRATQSGLRPPLALVTSNPMDDLLLQKWLRIPFHYTNGAESDSLSEGLPWTILSPACESSFALTEAAPWKLSDAPDFSSLFGFQGLL